MNEKSMKDAIKKAKKKSKKEYSRIPLDYDDINKYVSSSQFQHAKMGKPPFFNGENYTKWAYDMKMHLFSTHPLLWDIVVEGMKRPKKGRMTPELAMAYHRNAQATRMITSSLSLQEFNKIQHVEVAKDIWDILKESHEGTEMIKEGKIDTIHGQLEDFTMNDEETTQQMFDRLMVLVNNIRALGSEDWDDYKVTKKLLAAYSPKNFNIAAMIRRDKSFKKMSPILLCIQHENAEKDMMARLNKKGKKGIALKAKEEVEMKQKSSKPKKQEPSEEEDEEEESTDEETALLMRNFKKFMKTRNFKKTFGSKGRPKKRPCYKCGEYGHFIAECPNKDDNKDEDKKDKYKKEEKSRGFKKSYDSKKKYHKQAHLGVQWTSSDEESEDEDEGIATIAIQKPSSSSSRLFPNMSSDDEDDAHHCFMARGTKVKNKSRHSSSKSSSSDNDNDSDSDFEIDEPSIEECMIKKFGKKGFKEIKKLMKEVEKRDTSLSKQEDLLILMEERNRALEEELTKERQKIKKLGIDLSLTNDSHKRASKDLTLANEALAKLKSSYSELQNSFSCLEGKYKDLEVNYSVLWESTSSQSKVTLDSNASTSEGCSKCYKVDINACLTNLAKLKELNKAKDNQIKRLNMLVRFGHNGEEQSKNKTNRDAQRDPRIKDGLGHTRGEKVNGRNIIKGKEVVQFTKGTTLGEVMNVAHGVPKGGVSKDTTPKVKESNKGKSKEKVKVTHEPSPSYTLDYAITIDHNNKMVVKYVGPLTKKPIMKSVYVPKMFSANLKGPKSFWVPKPRA